MLFKNLKPIVSKLFFVKYKFLDISISQHQLTYDVNTQGIVNMLHIFLQDLIDRPQSHIVNIASASGFTALPGGTTYASSKAAVSSFSESLRLELKKDGTIMKSEILDHARMNRPGQGFYKVLAESALRAVKLCQPLRVPTTGYERWKELQLNFDAREMLEG